MPASACPPGTARIASAGDSRVAALSAAITGYAAGFANKHYRLPAAVVLLLIAAVTLTIVDLTQNRVLQTVQLGGKPWTALAVAR